MSFFKQFPKVEYDFNQTGVKQNMVDIYRHVKPLPTFLDSFSAYNFYEIRNGERPDIVSTRLYGTSEFYWTFFVVNDFLHDGYRAWPMSQEQLQKYMEKEYNGFAIETNPKTTNNFEDSLSGRFTLGETITGATSGATGTLTKKNIDMSQLIVQNVTGAFIGELVGITNTSELITGSTSADTVSTYRVFKYADAPYYYYNENHGTGAIEKIVLTNGGSNYTSIPTVTFSGNGNRIPTATATISGGKVTAININNRGSGHTTLTITITGGGGSGAEARVVLYPNEKLPVTNAVHVDGGVADSDLAYVTNRDHEFNLNEDRSKIRYVDPNYIGQFIDKYKKAINT